MWQEPGRKQGVNSACDTLRRKGLALESSKVLLHLCFAFLTNVQ